MILKVRMRLNNKMKLFEIHLIIINIFEKKKNNLKTWSPIKLRAVKLLFRVRY